jgi:hypothetical protein
MKKFIKFPSIEQFRTIVTNINRTANFVGLDENGEAIYDPTLPKPVITFKGTVKLHGTNAGVCGNMVDGIWVQSRKNIITPESDNAGFAFFVESKKDVFIEMITKVFLNNELDMIDNTVSIYGEWCGKNIQKGVGISNIDKSFFIFGVKITPHDESKSAYWVDYSYLRSESNNIYNIDDYPTYSVEIDFNRPQLVQNTLSDLTLSVEEECPVAKAFGFDNTIGEGIVWTAEHKGSTHRFKVKGELHAGKSKVKTLNKVDDEKINKCIELAEKVTPTWRLEQMVTETFDLINGGTLDVKRTGEYIKSVVSDIVKEETLTISDAGLELKDITKYISQIAKNYLFQKLNEESGLN